MATDVDVQYFSHLNGLTLGNNWGDLIRLLDKALVTGIDFTQITAASIDAQGDVHITLYAAHNAMLFQVVELSGFAPASLNQKYRIKGVPSATELILKPHTAIVETSITTVGAGKLASLGYEIIFRDANDVKRVYRAKNPRSEHPFIRVDESISDGTNSYSSVYAKSAMIGLLENMTHIDDFENPDVLQLPHNTSNIGQNFKIVGTGNAVVRGRCKLYWGMGTMSYSSANETTITSVNNGPYNFSLVGDKDAVYFLNPVTVSSSVVTLKSIKGFGLFNSALDSNIVPNWFLAVPDRQGISASANATLYATGGMPFCYNLAASKVLTTKYNNANRLANSTEATPLLPNYTTGLTTIFNSTNIGALEIPFHDSESHLRGTFKHIYYSGNTRNETVTTPLIADTSMYVYDSVYVSSSGGGIYFYLGELE